MRTAIKGSTRSRALVCGLASAGLWGLVDSAQALPPANGPQLLLVITNSQSMGGTTSGAIMTGSGALQTNLPANVPVAAAMRASASPEQYTVPTGFTPPLQSAVAGMAPYTVLCGANQCDNGPSRMNMAKGAIKSVLEQYKNTVNFGVYSYNFMYDVGNGPTLTVGLSGTYAYYMTGASGTFGLTNTADATTVPNPCLNYLTTPAVNVACSAMDLPVFGGGTALNTSAFIRVGKSSDGPDVNDVLYRTISNLANSPPVAAAYGGHSADPFVSKTLADFNTNPGRFAIFYNQTAPTTSTMSGATPSNAGYVPSSEQVLFVRRGWALYGGPKKDTGYLNVAMGTDPDAAVFQAVLAPESSSTTSVEIKSAALQSPMGGLLSGARSYLSSLPAAGAAAASCSATQRAVLLLTDGLPTKDNAGNSWPPLGTLAAQKFNLTATFNADGSLQSTGSKAVTDAIDAIKALKTDGVKTYVIGLGAGVDATTNPMAAQVLKAMAVAGGTETPFSAANATVLQESLQSVVNAVSQTSGTSALSAPTAPLSLASGNGYVYQITSDAQPIKGHVLGIKVDSEGKPEGTNPSWDAGAQMTTVDRTRLLFASKNADGLGDVVRLSQVPQSAFNLSPSPCVPNTDAVVAYTINPSATPAAGCDYLAGRAPNWLLGGMTHKNSSKYVGPPGSATLSAQHSSYRTYAQNTRTRSPGLLYTSNDGFLYASNPTTGDLYWGWTTHSLLSKMQDFNGFKNLGATNGSFTVVDAWNSVTERWGTYVVGSFQSGAEHFSLKVNENGMPDIVVYDHVVAGGTSAGDLAGELGDVPARQTPIVRYGPDGSANYLYVVTAGGTSTLYSVNVATGTTTSLDLGFSASSPLFWDPARNALWLGATDGSVYTITRAANRFFKDEAFTFRNPANDSAVPVLYVNYAEVEGVPYVVVVGRAQLSVYQITSAGWTPLWATTPSQGYTYSLVNGQMTPNANANVAKLVAGSVVSDLPLLVGKDILLPVTAGSADCGANGYYNLFSIGSGSFPSATRLQFSDGTAITAPVVLSGIAYTPSVSNTSAGMRLFPPISTNVAAVNQAMTYRAQPRTSSWRQR